MLIALMYHRVGLEKHANPLEIFQKHLPFLKEHYPILLPGEPIKKISVCLTFDDAHYDFYHFIFPLLVKHQIRAILGVPVKYILPDTKMTASDRLSVHYTQAMQNMNKAPFCTWKELLEMSQSGLVQIASHSYSHVNLLDSNDLELEIKVSKKILEKELRQTISTFIYPYGRYNTAIQKKVSESYPYSFRIGSMLNKNWSSSPLSRLRADQLKTPDFPRFPDLIYPFFKKIFKS